MTGPREIAEVGARGFGRGRGFMLTCAIQQNWGGRAAGCGRWAARPLKMGCRVLGERRSMGGALPLLLRTKCFGKRALGQHRGMR